MDAIAEGKTEAQAQAAYAACEDVDEDISFDEWRKAIIEFDAAWHSARGPGGLIPTHTKHEGNALTGDVMM